MDLVTTWNTLLSICGGISIIGGTVALVLKTTSPYKKLKKTVENHSDYLEKDKSRLDEIENSNRIIQKSLLALLEHEITGNSIDKLKKTKAELQEYLVNK